MILRKSVIFFLPALFQRSPKLLPRHFPEMICPDFLTLIKFHAENSPQLGVHDSQFCLCHVILATEVDEGAKSENLREKEC